MATRLALYLTTVIIGVTSCLASLSTSASNADLKIIDRTGAPVRLSKVSIQNDSGRSISLIRYQVSNEAKRSMRRVVLKLIFFDAQGNPVGGDMFTEQLTLKAHHHAEFLTPLKHYAGENIGRIAVVLSEVETEKDTWKDDSSFKQLFDEMKE